MKKDYIKPEITIEDFDIETPMLLDTSYDKIVGEGGQGDLGSKDREDFEGEGDSGWGTLW